MKRPRRTSILHAEPCLRRSEASASLRQARSRGAAALTAKSVRIPDLRESARAYDDAGFTLLEMLVAVALLGMLSVVLFEGLHFGHRVWEASETTTASVDRIRAFRNDLAAALARAYPELDISQADKASQVKFDGEKDGMTFLTPAPDDSGALTEMSIRIDDSSGSPRLIERRHLELARVPGWATTDPRIPPISAAHFSYFGAVKASDKPEWHDSWSGQTSLPELVRISLAFSNRRYAWPDLVVAPRIAADVSCTFDMLARACVGR